MIYVIRLIVSTKCDLEPFHLLFWIWCFGAAQIVQGNFCHSGDATYLVSEHSAKLTQVLTLWNRGTWFDCLLGCRLLFLVDRNVLDEAGSMRANWPVMNCMNAVAMLMFSTFSIRFSFIDVLFINLRTNAQKACSQELPAWLGTCLGWWEPQSPTQRTWSQSSTTEKVYPTCS